VNDAPDKIKDLLESAIKANSAAWLAHSKYFDDLVQRNMQSFATLSSARDTSLKEIGESLTFNEAFEANMMYEEAVHDEVKKLKEENDNAWTELVAKLEKIYSLDSKDEHRP